MGKGECFLFAHLFVLCRILNARLAILMPSLLLCLPGQKQNSAYYNRIMSVCVCVFVCVLFYWPKGKQQKVKKKTKQRILKMMFL